jgi:hypothetical protein
MREKAALRGLKYNNGILIEHLLANFTLEARVLNLRGQQASPTKNFICFASVQHLSGHCFGLSNFLPHDIAITFPHNSTTNKLCIT